MYAEFIEKFDLINDVIFYLPDKMVEMLNLSEWITDAILDSIHTIPFLFVVFVFIELFEYFYADKIHTFMENSKKSGPVIGSLAAIVPQCGFSIIASALYTRKLITKGTLIAIYLATSDEAIPIILANPSKISLLLPIIGIKLIVAIIAGYLVDLLFKKNQPVASETEEEIHHHEEGCCKHDIVTTNKVNLWLHPLMHTVNVFGFVLVITLILNFIMKNYDIATIFTQSDFIYKFVEPFVTAIIGLIPNCAVSIALTMMLIKGTIGFGAAMAGLMSNAGLGLLVLLRKNENWKDSALIIFILVFVSVLCGVLLQMV